ncbi:F-box protein CPR1-like [Rhododendron vialii]|uniref:F-box protein CPR1-like n=1 Tax=Rhododendron vialii TaxID=182163 RepID=UPI00265DA67D|nr:F-box protein CPR1-like [Rhododendron vialii]
MPDLVIEVIIDILLRLPVKPLLRFRCVSKQFCALIDSQDFIRLHLKLSIETKNNLGLILRNSSFFSVDFDSLDTAVELDHPFQSTGRHRTEIFGSCHGLICLSYCLSNDREDLAIYPSTRRFQKFSFRNVGFNFMGCSAYFATSGFGYDSVTDDYKVVRSLEFLSPRKIGSLVKVYNMKSNSWREVKGFPYSHRKERRCGVFVGDALHWVVSLNPSDTANANLEAAFDLTAEDYLLASEHANLVAAFDLTAEDYQLVLQPEFSDKNFHINIVELGECLCILCNYREVRVDVWVMKDYGYKESWSKQFCVVQPEVIRSLEFLIPLGEWLGSPIG